MNYLVSRMLVERNDLNAAESLISKNLEIVRRERLKKREGSFLRVLGEVVLRRGETDAARSRFEEAIEILKAVGNPRKLWEAHASLASAFDHMGRHSEARDQWCAAAEVLNRLAKNLSDRELRTGFLEAKPIREILAKAER